MLTILALLVLLLMMKVVPRDPIDFAQKKILDRNRLPVLPRPLRFRFVSHYCIVRFYLLYVRRRSSVVLGRKREESDALRLCTVRTCSLPVEWKKKTVGELVAL